MSAHPPIPLAALDFDLYVEAAPATVWEFWVDPDRMREWWGTEHELDARAGGVFRVVMGDHGPTMSGRYVELDPPERLVFLFGWEELEAGVPPGSTRVEVSLTADGSGTRLRLRHTALSPDAAELHREGWTRFLGILVAVAGASR